MKERIGEIKKDLARGATDQANEQHKRAFDELGQAFGMSPSPRLTPEQNVRYLELIRQMWGEGGGPPVSPREMQEYSYLARMAGTLK